MSRRARTWLVLLAAVGLGASAASTWVHLQILTDPAYVSVCDVNATVSCSQVYESRYGSVFGVPVALGGVVWFVGVLMLALASARAPAAAQANIAGYLLAWSTVGLAVSMYLAYSSFFVLGMVCLFCVAVYVTVIGIFILAGNAPATPALKLPVAAPGDLRLLARSGTGLALALLFVVGSIGSTTWFYRLASTDPVELQAAVSPPAPAADTGGAGELLSDAEQQTEFERYWSAETRVELELPQAAAALTGDADVVVLKFNDYQCPRLRQRAPRVRADLREVRFVAFGAGDAGDHRLPARSVLQRGSAARPAPGRLRGGRRGPPGRSAGRRGPGRHGGVALQQSGWPDARVGSRGDSGRRRHRSGQLRRGVR